MRLVDTLRSLIWRVFRAPEDRRATLDRFVESSRDALCQLGPDLGVRYMSPAARTVFGYDPEAMIGRPITAFIADADLPVVHEAARAGAAREAQTPTRVRVRHPDGRLVWVEASGRTLFDPVSGRPSEILLVIRDISERKALEARLAEEALTDGLTGLANRRAFDEALEREWRRAGRDRQALSLVLLDLDCFKSFNDLYGHPEGDAALRRAALAVKAALKRPGDFVARYGGEELAIILPGAGAAGSARVAEMIREAVEGLLTPHAGSPWGRVTASLGVASAGGAVHDTMRSPEALVLAADSALYRAKAAGRNRVETTRLLAAVDDSRAA